MNKILEYYQIANKVNKISKIDIENLEKSITGFYDLNQEYLMPIYLDPSNSLLEEFKYRLEKDDIYNTGVAKEILSYLTKDNVLDTTSIEHIRPQEIYSKGWKREDYFETIHSLGNLTLTNKNSQLSNKDFLNKKEIYREEYIDLNRDIIDKDIWSKEEIHKRSERLAEELIKKICPLEEIRPNMFTQDSYIVNIFGYPLTKYRIELVEYKDETSICKNERDLLSLVISWAYRKDKDKLIRLADEKPFIGQTLMLSTSDIDIRISDDLHNLVFYNVGLSKQQYIKFIKFLTEEFDLKYIMQIRRSYAN